MENAFVTPKIEDVSGVNAIVSLKNRIVTKNYTIVIYR
jgi:hypothetical protein